MAAAPDKADHPPRRIFGASIDPSSAWAVDACWLPLPLADSHGGRAGGGALFLDIVKGEDGWVGDPAAQERFVRWGYRFEALCTAQPVADPNHEYNVLLSTRLAAHRLLMAAELDCFDPALLPSGSNGGGGGPAAGGPAAGAAQAGVGNAAAAAAAATAPPQASWVELKTYRLPGHAGQRRTLNAHKHPKWWLQSFLAGVPRLALGGRDDEVTARLSGVEGSGGSSSGEGGVGSRGQPLGRQHDGTGCPPFSRRTLPMHCCPSGIPCPDCVAQGWLPPLTLTSPVGRRAAAGRRSHRRAAPHLGRQRCAVEPCPHAALRRCSPVLDAEGGRSGPGPAPALCARRG